MEKGRGEEVRLAEIQFHSAMPLVLRCAILTSDYMH